MDYKYVLFASFLWEDIYGVESLFSENDLFFEVINMPCPANGKWSGHVVKICFNERKDLDNAVRLLCESADSFCFKAFSWYELFFILYYNDDFERYFICCDGWSGYDKSYQLINCSDKNKLLNFEGWGPGFEDTFQYIIEISEMYFDGSLV
jgi:hypothetical protein